jgi:hypothetical protein
MLSNGGVFVRTTTTDPTTGLPTRAQFPGNVIPTNRLNPIAVKILNYLPLPNVSGLLSANYVDVPKQSYLH